MATIHRSHFLSASRRSSCWTRAHSGRNTLPCKPVRPCRVLLPCLLNPNASSQPQPLRITRAGQTEEAAVSAATDTPGDEDEQLTESQRTLNSFLVWLVANDVQGIGLDDSPTALYEGEDGERGIIALKAIRKGDVILRVPLRLALTDHQQDHESNKLMYEDAPWSVRLSTKLLRERARGPRSPWHPYLSVLPARVPAPLEVFSWEDMQQVEWPPAQAAIYDYNWLVTGAYTRAAGSGPGPEQLKAVQEQMASRDAGGTPGWLVSEERAVGSPAPDSSQIQQVLGGADAEQFQWAMSVVHSRTFANAARGGGVGVRMLVPLVDMLNHAGDVTASGLMDDTNITPTDNVRWDVVSPERSALGCWEMAVSATADISEGSPLLLSYGDRPSDDFFLHYGFVPPLCNPLENAVLFEDAEEALEWHHAQYAPQMPLEEAEAVYARAYTAALQEQKQAATPANTQQTQQQQQQQQQGQAQVQGQAQAQGQGQGQGQGEPQEGQQPSKPAKLPKGWEKLKAYAAGRVDAALITAFRAAMGGDTRAAEGAVACRARQLLGAMRTPLMMDLLALWQDAAWRADQQEQGVVAKLLLQQAEQQQQVEAAEARQAARAAAGGNAGSTAAPAAGVSGENGGNASAQAAATAGTGAAAAGAGAAPAAGSGEVSSSPAGTLDELVQSLNEQAAKLQEAGGVPPLLLAPLTSTQLLCVRFRAAKKIVLWGVVYRALCGVKQVEAGRGTDAAGVGASRPDGLAALPRRLGKQTVPLL